MPSCVRSFNIVSGSPNPNGTAAVLYTTCTSSHNNQAQWSTNDDSTTYTVTLPTDTFSPPSGSTNTFSVSKNNPSGVYTVLSTATDGSHGYTISPSLSADPPTVEIDS